MNATAKKSKSSLLYSGLLPDVTRAVLSLSSVLLKPFFLSEKSYQDEDEDEVVVVSCWTALVTSSALPPVEEAVSELSAIRRSAAENPYDPTLVEVFEPQKALITSTAFFKSPLYWDWSVNQIDGNTETKTISH